MNLPIQSLSILRHSLGYDNNGNGRRYRNHFCTGPGSADYPLCEALVEATLMTKRNNLGTLSGGDDTYHVTQNGIMVVEAARPPIPKTTRAQRRYRAFLDFDGGCTFIEFLKHYGPSVQ
jgi:hypothetical protein